MDGGRVRLIPADSGGRRSWSCYGRRVRPNIIEEHGDGYHAIQIQGEGPDPWHDRKTNFAIELALLKDQRLETRGKAWARVAKFLRKALAEAEKTAVAIWPRALPPLRAYVFEVDGWTRQWVAARSLAEAVGLLKLSPNAEAHGLGACHAASETECRSVVLTLPNGALGEHIGQMLLESPHPRVLGMSGGRGA